MGVEGTPGRSALAGHRSRLRARFRAVGDAGLAEHELLELLLTYAIPRWDTKGLAKALLGRFGSLAGIVEADADALEDVLGIGPAAATLILLIRPLSAHLLLGKKPDCAILKSSEAAVTFFRVRLKGLKNEEIHGAFVDAKNRLIAAECLQKGVADQSSVYVRHIIERALAHKASGFLLTHNHPNGDPVAATPPTPSPFATTAVGTVSEGLEPSPPAPRRA